MTNTKKTCVTAKKEPNHVIPPLSKADVKYPADVVGGGPLSTLRAETTHTRPVLCPVQLAIGLALVNKSPQYLAESLRYCLKHCRVLFV